MKLRNAGTVQGFFCRAGFISLFASSIFLLPAHASGTGWQQQNANMTASLQQAVRQFLAGNLPAASAGSEREIQLAEPDPRLQLSACRQALESFWPSNARRTGSTVVGIRCPDQPGWQTFLPVQIQEWSTVLVASRPLRPRERLQAADFKPLRVAREQLRGEAITDPAKLLGAITRQAIAVGQPLTGQLLCQICRGDEVRIAAGQDGFEVIMKGIAEGSGNVGDRVAVRNLSSRRTIQAEIVASGLVKVSL